MPEYSDAAKRIKDAYSLHQIGSGFDSVGKWFAAKLHDGTSDDVLYESKSAAVRYQKHDEQYYLYVQITPHTMTYGEAETLLSTFRKMYDAGLRLADRDHPGGGYEPIKRLTQEDQYNQLRAMFIGDVAPSNLIIPGR